ncbi:RDD family protein [Flavobacterium sp. F-380]|uniref:RDD family protein n=1 Tax=Flavobacterium kayseriense TaxID=2764714 RepID=A0ABR7J6K7_9FLAO|nr:RDD family protein [Flavobacterium kayseriense]MBC5841170.1 RDD family protein [Flavobacterium kayseriense]MBC5847698.1 RDD family protein [Flavobacterium kayseriense]MBU0939908.1 RDD family protein [Bacteroidota bacterium]
MNPQKKNNLGKRFIAGLIDYTIIFTVCYVFIYSFGSPNDEGGYSVTGLLALIPTVIWFSFTVLLELLFGATVGNSVVGLEPKSLTRNNGQLTFSQSFKRHLLDPLDMFPFGLIGLITIKNTAMHQRLGDIWAKTIVVNKDVIK